MMLDTWYLMPETLCIRLSTWDLYMRRYTWNFTHDFLHIRLYTWDFRPATLDMRLYTWFVAMERCTLDFGHDTWYFIHETLQLACDVTHETLYMRPYTWDFRRETLDIKFCTWNFRHDALCMGLWTNILYMTLYNLHGTLYREAFKTSGL
jgi:hypothetical protein